MSLPLDQNRQWHAVFYADGGAIPNPGFTGYGLHGYFFDLEEAELKKAQVIPNHFMESFNNDKAAKNAIDYVTPTQEGYIPCKNTGEFLYKFQAKPVKPSWYVDRSFAFAEPGTNNIGEMAAALEALQVAVEAGSCLKRIVMCLDSQYVLDTLQKYIHDWKRNGWKKKDGEPPKNLEMVKIIDEKLRALEAQGTEVFYTWVKGHNGNMGNGMADYMASVGVRAARNRTFDTNERTWSVPKDYWAPDVERHPFMYHKRAYFNRVKKFNVPGWYYLIEPASADLMIGKRDHEGYAVVRLKTPCPYMEAVIEAQGTFGQDVNHIVLVRMERLYNKFVQKFIKRFGSLAFEASRSLRDVWFLDKTPVAVEHNPPALIYRVTDAFASLDARLNDFLTVTGQFDSEPGEESKTGIVVHEVTSEFFETVEKKVGKEVIQKMVLLPVFGVGYTNHSLEVSEEVEGKTCSVKIAMALGMDLPSRNQLKQLEDHNPKIYLITWRDTPTTLQYAFVVDSLTGTGIWSNYFCDRVFLKPIVDVKNV